MFAKAREASLRGHIICPKRNGSSCVRSAHCCLGCLLLTRKTGTEASRGGPAHVNMASLCKGGHGLWKGSTRKERERDIYISLSLSANALEATGVSGAGAWILLAWLGLVWSGLARKARSEEAKKAGSQEARKWRKRTSPL